MVLLSLNSAMFFYATAESDHNDDDDNAAAAADGDDETCTCARYVHGSRKISAQQRCTILTK